MKELIPMDEYGVFADMKDTARVDSRLVAQMFEKEHKNVLQNIDAILKPDSRFSKEFNRLNFQPISYKDAMNRKQRAYAMTRASACWNGGSCGKRRRSERACR